MLFETDFLDNLANSNLRRAIAAAYRANETEIVENLLARLDMDPATEQTISALARQWVSDIRQKTHNKTGIQALMIHYDLATEEGILLMCLAEALLRVPDEETENLLIRDKLTSANWQAHVGASASAFVNMATWGLALTGKLLQKPVTEKRYSQLWKKMIRRSGEPVIRKAVREAMRLMSQQFVLGRDITEALQRSTTLAQQGYTFSYDMLGEVARTQADADRYFAAYQQAIGRLASAVNSTDLTKVPSISVKLSALHPRYEFSHAETCIPALIDRLMALALAAQQAGIALTVDAEEAERLDLSLTIFKSVFVDQRLADWEGLGLAVQAYQKRAMPVLDWLISIAREQGKRIQVRLVKGAYWDSEIKQSQIGGFADYPVFTRKTSTDVNYLACAKHMLAAQDAIYPQFATHNVFSVAAIITMMGDTQYDYEFQKLQGMGESLHDLLLAQSTNTRCRIYAPVGTHEDLLPYLVRRLLENGANSSFVNQLSDKQIPIEQLIANPIEATRQLPSIPHPHIPLPQAIYGAHRVNSAGFDITEWDKLQTWQAELATWQDTVWRATPPTQQGELLAQYEPANQQTVVGEVMWATKADLQSAVTSATAAWPVWRDTPLKNRCELLLAMADILEANRPELMMLIIREAGRTVPDAISEIREAVDFCRYYAEQARKTLKPRVLPGPTGESNTLYLSGRGVMLCISPWNFPVAIFVGQIVAALVTGNCVLAKPAEQTSLVAARVVELFYQVGISKQVLQLLPATGELTGEVLIPDERISGVLFTGSTDTAKRIQRGLAAREGAIVPLIAETGGINAMVVDSTALPEQLVADVLASAFGSAGQRCSALRLLLLQDDIADRVIEMLRGAMQTWSVGIPQYLSSDNGPVIDAAALQALQKHEAIMAAQAKLIYKVDLPNSLSATGTYCAPQAYELPALDLLQREVFGPILHVLRYARDELPAVLDQVDALGYGLTFGVQTRITERAMAVSEYVSAGNVYVNRNMIGAVVGVQPFGGSRLSGTGPKAGGPHYLLRLCNEKTISIDTTAAGGNASLMTLE